MRKTCQSILSLVLVAGVLATGGVHLLSYILMELAIFTVFLLLLLQQAKKSKIELPYAPVLLMLVILVVIQITPLPAGIIRWISPQRWANLTTDPSSGVNSWLAVSVYPHATQVALVKLFAYLIAFSLGAYLFDSRKRRGLLLVLVGLGLTEALLGLVLYLGGWGNLIPFTSDTFSNRARGTYINPNHYAGLLAMTFPLLFGWIYYLHQKSRDYFPKGGSAEPGRQRLSRSGQVPFYMFLLLVMLVSLVVSRSRMGIFAGLSSFLFLVLLTQLKGRQTRLLLGSFVVLGGVVAYLLWIGLDPIVARFETVLETDYLQGDTRFLVWKDELRLLRDYPWLGTGLGTFGIAFKNYQASSVNYWFDQAHNDYLQFATELGLVGFLALFGAIFYLMIRMIRSFMNDPSRFRASVTLGCIGGAGALLVHSVADFNLQIPANAMVFAVILGIGYKASCLERRAEARSK